MTIRPPEDRGVQLRMNGEQVAEVLDVDADVVVFQRLTHGWMAQSVALLREQGVAVVVDVDDDLSSIHPRNPAYEAYHPFRGTDPRHSWENLKLACRTATLVTVSTPALLSVYAKHGRGHVLYNCLPDIYENVPHTDSEIIGWPASLQSHPDDPSALHGAIARLSAEGADFRIVGDPSGVGSAFGLPQDPTGLSERVDVFGWPAAVADLGIGVAPLADTRFNACKSWLKPLEMSALGVPWVGSPRAEYVRLNQKGAGLLADNSRRWYQKLSQLRANPALRQEVAEAGFQVAAQFRLRDHAWRWAESWQRAYEIQRTPARGSAPVTA